MSAKKTITIILIVLLAGALVTASVVFLPPLFSGDSDGTPSPTVTDAATTPGGTESPSNTSDVTTPDTTSKGTYEGEYDVNGKRSGYGVWVYDNFRYEGYWDNDMPNGEGTLYEALTPPNGVETFYKSNQGYWVNGFAKGEIKHRKHYENSRNAMTWQFNVTNGYPTKDETVYINNGEGPL